MSIAPWNTAAGRKDKTKEPSPCLVAVCEDMPRKAIDIHPVRLTIQEAAVDGLVLCLQSK